MMPRRELFQKYQEPFFRKEELSQFEELLLDGYELISVGGGAHIQKDLRRYKLVWLKLPINIIQARIDPEAPYLKGVCFEDWMYQRQKNYADKAQIEVELTGVDLYADANRLWQAILLAGISH